MHILNNFVHRNLVQVDIEIREIGFSIFVWIIIYFDLVRISDAVCIPRRLSVLLVRTLHKS